MSTKKTREDLVLEANTLYSQYNVKTLLDIFKIMEEKSLMVESQKVNIIEYHALVTYLLSIYKNGKVLFVEDFEETNDDKPTRGGKVEIVAKHGETLHRNVTIITIHNIYPAIIESKYEMFNIVNYKEIVNEIYVLKEQLSEDRQIYKDMINFYLNYIFGVSMRKNDYLITDINHAFVVNRARNILTRLINDFSGHIIYVDTDTIYLKHFEEIRERFMNKINNLTHNFKLSHIEEEQYDNFFLKSEKKYLLFNNNEDVKIRGFR